MIKTMSFVTAQIPFGFGMPTCTSASVLRPSDFGGTTAPVVRDRQENSVATAHLGLAPAYLPGTSAWSPPTS